MTVFVEGKKSFFMATSADVVDYDVDTASSWASKYIVKNPALKWIVANYVEADNPNSNGQLWPLAGLQEHRSSIDHSPINMGHNPHHVVGSWVANELIYPTDVADTQIVNPFVQTVGALWKFYFPQEVEQVERAYEAASLFVSMECVSESITCIQPEGCDQTFAYDGVVSDSYCAHLNNGGQRRFNNPHFLAGGLIIPPKHPGWRNAEVQDLSSLVKHFAAEELVENSDNADAWVYLMKDLMLRGQLA